MIIPNGLSAYPITPADADGRVDTTAFRRIIARLVQAGVDSIGALGSTGTYMYLGRQERRRALEVALEATGGRIPVIAGIGALRTDDAVRLAQDAAAIGAVAGLLSAVSYTPLTDDEVFEHFTTVARESGLPICIYDNPGTTRFQFSPELVRRLAAHPGIVGIKNPTESPAATVSDLDRQRAFAPRGFSIGYSGDWNCSEAMIAGADVWHSALAGTLPEVCLRIVECVARGEHERARAVNATLEPLWALFRAHSSLRVLYCIVQELGLAGGRQPPRPILPLSDVARRDVLQTMEMLE